MPEVIQKALATVQPGDDDAESPNGSFELILSTPELDRDGDILAQTGWKTPLPDHIVMDIDHGMSVATTAGSGEPFFDSDGNIRVKGTYASTDTGQTTRTLVNEGHIRTASVSFMTDKSVKDGAPSRELLNGAFVAVPSNRSAVVLSSKAFQAIEAETKADKPKPPYGNVAYADPGFLDRQGKPAKDGNGLPRYPLNTAQRVRTGWGYIHHEDIAAQYTAEQLAHIKDKLKAAAAKFGIKVDDSKAFRDAMAIVGKFLAGEDDVEPTTKARNPAADQLLLQNAHDALALLGAQCMEPAEDPDSGADDGANKSAEAVETPGLTAAQFDSLLAAITKTTGPEAGSPPAEAPADAAPEAAPDGPADGPADAADEAEVAQKKARHMLMGLFAAD